MHNILFPSTKYGIPLLDIRMQAHSIELPFEVWGRSSRSSARGGTRCFYTDDYKFSALWKHPESLCRTGIKTAVEANYSTNEMQPEAFMIYNVFKKRWLSRYWQSNGISMIVDLNVDVNHMDINLIGVPSGWGAFATRAHRGRNEEIRSMFDVASSVAGGVPEMFVVYGGGQEVKAQCETNSWIWVPEHMQVVKTRSEV